MLYMIPTKYHLIVGAFLYAIGIYLSESYSCIWGEPTFYNAIFLTSRNGVFFGFPLMVVGEKVAYNKSGYNPYKNALLLFLSLAAYFVEVSIIGHISEKTADRSFYVMIPLVCFFLLRLLMRCNPCINTKRLRKYSTAIYVMQYGIITICSFLFVRIGIEVNNITKSIITYVCVVCIPIFVFRILNKYNVDQYVF